MPGHFILLRIELQMDYVGLGLFGFTVDNDLPIIGLEVCHWGRLLVTAL